jgi:hypothetical protein
MPVPITATYGTIVVKALTDLPARLLGGAGIDVVVAGFDYRIDLDIEELPVSPLGAANGKFTAVWDEADGTYKKIEFTQLPAPFTDWSVITSKPATFPPTLPITQSDVTNLVTDLAAKLNNNAPVDGKTYGRKDGAWQDVAAGVSIVVNWGDIVGKPTQFPPSPHPHAQSDINALVADLAARELIVNKGAANGYAPLGADSKVPTANLPLQFPEAPTDGNIYGRRGADASWQSLAASFVTKTGATGAGVLPVGTTAQRPSTVAGYIRFNSETLAFEGNNGLAWAGLGGGVTVSVTAPSSPRVGDLWWASDLGLMFVWYSDATSSQWVVTNPGIDIASLDTRYKQITDGGLYKISSGSLASAAAAIDITLPAGFTGGYELLLSGFAPVTDAQAIVMRFSPDGSTFLAANYQWALNVVNALASATNTPAGSITGTFLALMSAMGNAAGTRFAARVTIPPILAGVVPSAFYIGHLYAGSNYGTVHGSGTISTGMTGTPLAVRLLATSGNIQAGAAWQLNGYK